MNPIANVAAFAALITSIVGLLVIGGYIFRAAYKEGVRDQRLDTLEKRPTTDGDCAIQLAKMNERLDGVEKLFEAKFDSLRDVLHEVVSRKPQLRAVASKERASGRN